MQKLVEDIEIGEQIKYEQKRLVIVEITAANGEGRVFVAKSESGEEIKFSKSCGTYLNIAKDNNR